MLNKLLPGLSLTALLLTSCKKQNDVAPTFDNRSGQQSSTTATQPGTSVSSPSVFFTVSSKSLIGMDTLYKISNISASEPTIHKELITGSLNSFSGTWAYNTNTKEITTLGTVNTLDKFSTSKFTLTSQSTQGKLCNADLRISPDNSVFYCIGGMGDGSILKGNVKDGSGLVQVFSDPMNTKITALDVDFKNNVAYIVDAVSKSLFSVNLKDGTKTWLGSLPTSANVKTNKETDLRFDASANRLYFSSVGLITNGVPGKLKLWSLTTSGDPLGELLATTTEAGISFAFDIVPNKKIIYSLYRPSTGTSVVESMNIDGTGKTTLHFSNKTKNIVVAMP